MRVILKWLSGAIIAVLAAVFLLAVSEAGFRLAGQGNDTSFLIRRETPSGLWYASNRAFYQQFFNLPLGAIVHWDDLEFAFPAEKSPETFRVFVFGGSAANGTPPDTAYAFWRVLQAMLEKRYPERRFEFCCVASPGANSHVMAAAARSCAQHQPDLFLICMGNNEFIGPYGAGSSITKAYQPSLTRIRLQQMVRGLRLYQWMEGMAPWRELSARVVTAADVWRYLTPIDPDSEPIQQVVKNFEANLSEMIRLADAAGAAAVVVPPLTNLKDWPPFVSAVGRGLTQGQRAEWSRFWREGRAHEQADQPEAALQSYLSAAAIDDRHAELCWRIGQLLLRRQKPAEAKKWLIRARDRDWVIARAPSRILEATRRVVRVTDAVLIDQFPAKNPDTWIPGQDEVFDNVHPTFEGNWLLAAACYPVVARLLERSGAPGSGMPSDPPDRETVRARLALTAGLEAEHCDAVTRKMTLWGRGPLDEVLRRIAQRKQILAEQAKQRGEDQGLALWQAWQRHPEDYWIGSRLFWHLVNTGKTDEARTVLDTLTASHPARRGAQRARIQFDLRHPDHSTGALELQAFLRRFPDDGAGWELLAGLQYDRGDYSGTIKSVRRALREDPTLNGARFLLAQALEKTGQVAAALEAGTEALAVDPEDQAVAELLDRLLADWSPEDKAQFWGGIVRKNPGCWTARLRELEIRRTLGQDTPEAWQHLLQYARDCGPRAWSAQYAALGVLGRPEEQRAVLADAVRWNPADFRPYEEADRLLQTDLPRRIQFWEDLASEVPGCRVWFHLGRARETGGDLAAAIEAYRKAVTGCPDDPAMVASLGFGLLRTGRLNEALEPLRHAASINPEIPGIQDAIRQAESALSVLP